ncbi:MAG TPA: ATP-binding domain-containing protein [Actinomycetota bacterium]|jgi:DNA helicase IV|nr:ATP-binding domain-containing protein [Actinomycetota bacterium]
MQSLTTELEQEQAYVSMLYRRLDTLRERARTQLEGALGQDGGGNVQARVDRDAFVARHSARLAQLDAAEHGLCFGRLDHADGSHLYIGRLGLLDDDREPLLVDWRAPAAQPFYRATWAAPEGVVRRRHLRTRGREVIGIEDDVLNLEQLSEAEREGLSGEAALLAALTASRTGRMTDIVATIQGEQDRIIRSGLPGVLVVQGGPGTGKTAVALHRAAYLLYTHRQRLARRGVLVVGPNPTFLRYIEQVLPSLGETDVLLSTVGGLFPGVAAAAEEPLEVAAVKGDPRMVEVLAAAITDRQRVPDEDVVVEVGGQRLVLDRATAGRARERARATGEPHNQARTTFRGEVVEALTDQLVAGLTRDLPEVDFGEEGDELLADLFPDERLLDPDRDELRAELAGHPAVRSALDRFWPKLTAQRLVGDLLRSAERLAAAGAALEPAERDLLRRPAPAGGDPAVAWTPADVPLLDEAAVLLGDDGARARRAEARQAEQDRAELAYAREVLAGTTIGDAARYAPDTSRLDPSVLAGRWRSRGPQGGLAERARQDRGWVFGHVIVDEAQELSAMAWRMLMRRSPSRSMTVVGDMAQAGSTWGPGSWARALDPYAPGRWRVEELTVNYRTPAEIMAVAADVLASMGGGQEPPRSVREAGVQPWHLRLGPDRLAAELPALVAAEAAAAGQGKLAVLVPPGRAEEVAGMLAGTVAVATTRQGPSVLDAPVAVLTVAEAKGLEFDAVVVLDPAAVLTGSRRGPSDLYVALTRATARLGVVHPGELPPVLVRLAPLSPSGPAARAAR